MDTNLETKVSMLFPIFEIVLSKEDLELLTNAKENELANFHFGFGLYIRNNILNPQGILYSIMLESGFKHKDDMSAKIIKLFHQYLNKNLNQI